MAPGRGGRYRSGVTDEIVIFGAGGHAKVVIEAVRGAFPDAPLAIADDAAEPRRSVLGVPVAGDRAWLARRRPAGGVVPALGGNGPRDALLAWLAEQGLRVRAIVAPGAVLSPSARLGDGAFLAPGALVNAEARIGAGAIVNTGASVDHDCDIGVAAHIAPGAHLCGNVAVGARTLVGAGATIIPGIRVGEDVVIGAGSVVIRDLGDGARVAGAPARPV